MVVNPDGRTLRTQALKYDNATNTISTDVPFTFDRGDEHLEGNSFKSDPDFKNVVTDKPRGVTGRGMLLPGQGADSCAPTNRAPPVGSRHRKKAPVIGALTESRDHAARAAFASTALHAQAKPAQPKPKPAPVEPSPPAAGQPGRCVFQIDNVDRQGAVNETRRHQLLRGRKCQAAVPRHPDLYAERQRRGIWRVGRAVHRQREVS